MISLNWLHEKQRCLYMTSFPNGHIPSPFRAKLKMRITKVIKVTLLTTEQCKPEKLDCFGTIWVPRHADPCVWWLLRQPRTQKNGTCIRTYLKYTVDAPFFFSIVGIKGLPGYFSTWGDMCNMRLALRDEEPTGFSRIYSDNMFWFLFFRRLLILLILIFIFHIFPKIVDSDCWLFTSSCWSLPQEMAVFLA